MLKQALRYLGVGFFLSACLLLALVHTNLLTNQPVQIAQISTSTVQNKQTTSSSYQSSQTTTPQATSSETTTQQSSSSAGQEKKITVSEHEDSHSIVDKLVAQGIISQAEPLLNYLMEKQLDTKLQNGTFTIPVGATIEQLADILTTYPGN